MVFTENNSVKLGILNYCGWGHYMFTTTNTQMNSQMNLKPLKAGKANKWVIMRESADEAPNFFFTIDHKNFSRLTNLQPQKDYNWLTSELITWKQLDGKPSQGILYKPENFDPSKKYPVIFYYYQDLSDGLYQYHAPEFTKSAINIPWFVEPRLHRFFT